VQVEALLKLRPARDPYWRAWLERTLAECHLDAGNIGSAQMLLSNALAVFREFGDVRREATILMIQGQAAMQAGDIDKALSGFASSLERYRTLGYAAARERILHELRAWKHRYGVSEPVRQRIADLIAAEPEKRYVGRFIRSYLSLLQFASILALPLALLLLAVVAPTTNVISLVGGVLSATTFYDPLRIVIVIASLAVCYLGIYAALALVVIYLLPINRIEREQPDVIITRPGEIARYNSMGDLALELPWAEVGRWLALDRCIWDRPMALYSRTFLEDTSGRDLMIDGITGWYGDVQTDIGHRLEVAGSAVQRKDLGYQLLKSKSGAAVVTGMALLLLVTMFENRWIQVPIWFPAGLYALISFLALSGALILGPLAYWIANRPLKLQRALLLNENWPNLLIVIGALPVLLYIVSAGRALSIDALNYSTFVWGVYVLSEALVARFMSTLRGLRLPLVVLATLLALLVVARPAYAAYRWQVGYTAKGQISDAIAVGSAPTSTSETSCSTGAADALALGNDPFSTYMIQGDCAAVGGDWKESSGYYQQAADSASPGSGEQALALYNFWNATRRFDRSQSAAALKQLNQLCATSPRARPICIQIVDQVNSSMR
jgi:tetratricopeptide (TPR) repeat protein